ncbi:hypothetical protein CH63R_03766 [Colletotrichum higginsianum IMI 349063]|uniref:Uncharacterized protein n=1 Tax=Colletotrichum higginsianum (strain IMI 349063) TaxID=759273 RepID=A0A1B7YHP3_COLHI|nr:hypothetical protein CH63R_03766 [Colletotrichum higginsianum IMI 349063]OBR11470.1 hypothetical protein CH63R_03766 [Colletotrichum higginsianum IMI 349063]
MAQIALPKASYAKTDVQELAISRWRERDTPGFIVSHHLHLRSISWRKLERSIIRAPRAWSSGSFGLFFTFSSLLLTFSKKANDKTIELNPAGSLDRKYAAPPGARDKDTDRRPNEANALCYLRYEAIPGTVETW